MGEILIIGAGPAGMAAAMELSKANKKFLVDSFEQKQLTQIRIRLLIELELKERISWFEGSHI